MYGTFMLFDEAGKLEKGERVYLGNLKAKDEAWLRDTLFSNPEIIPVDDIDPTFGPLVPLCTELRTDAGNIDDVFISERGRLTIVECKLWKNPQARREVVAQTLDYVSALSGWSYADLQRQVAAAVGRKGNIPFELVREHTGQRLREPEFVDAVSRSLREGRFLVLLAGDGIREGVQALTELVNRNASKAFTFGVIEIAVYRFGKSRFAIQPRVLAKTEVVTRQMTIVSVKGEAESTLVGDDLSDSPEIAGEGTRSGDKKRLRAWWQPVLQMKFDDPEQEPPRWLVTNNIALRTPYPGIQIKAWAMVDGKQTGVYVTGPTARLDEVEELMRKDKKYLTDNLPKGTIVDPRAGWPIVLKNEDSLSDADRYAWLKKTLNEFANVLRPRLRKWYEETQPGATG
jgi:hypothetical protein